MYKLKELSAKVIDLIPVRVFGMFCVIVCVMFIPWEAIKGFRALWSTHRNVYDNMWHWWVNGMKPSLRYLIKGR